MDTTKATAVSSRFTMGAEVHAAAEQLLKPLLVIHAIVFIRCTSLSENEAIVAPGKTFVNQENTTDSCLQFLNFCAERTKQIFLRKSRILFPVFSLILQIHCQNCTFLPGFRQQSPVAGIWTVTDSLQEHLYTLPYKTLTVKPKHYK